MLKTRFSISLSHVETSMKNLILFIASGFIIFNAFNASSMSTGNEVFLNDKHEYEDKAVFLRFVEFTPAQIGSFYEGREFSKAAIEKLTAVCYVTVVVKNKTDDILWLDLAAWEFSLGGKIFTPLSRGYWQQQWDAIEMKKAHRATFGWTLMPQLRNLYPDEGVGGRIPIPMQSKPFSVTLNFPTGKNKQGKLKSLTINHLVCKQDVARSPGDDPVEPK